MNRSFEPVAEIFRKRKIKMYDYYLVGPDEIPVRVYKPNYRIEVYRWRTGDFEINFDFGRKITGIGDYESAEKEIFNQYIEDLRACLTMSLPRYYVRSGFPVKAFRDAEGNLRIIGYDARNGENIEMMTLDIVQYGIGEIGRVSKEEYDKVLEEKQTYYHSFVSSKREKARNDE
jgi:hypothetical protein